MDLLSAAKTEMASLFGSLKKKIKSRSPSPNPGAPGSPTLGRKGSFVKNNPFASSSPPTAEPFLNLQDNNDPPPPSYAEAIGQDSSSSPFISLRSASPAPSIRSYLSTSEDKYAFLRKFDTKFLIDDSGSMQGRRWQEVAGVLRAITPICTERDADGIDVYFINHNAPGGYKNIRTPEQVDQLFRSTKPIGGTMTGWRINQILLPEVVKFEEAVRTLKKQMKNKDAIIDTTEIDVKPVNLIVITDGEAQDDVESYIKALAQRLDNVSAPAWQIGIQFFQVGDDAKADAALRQLDDGLTGVRDMVDKVSWTDREGSEKTLSADGILKTVLGAVHRRLDRMEVESSRRYLRP